MFTFCVLFDEFASYYATHCCFNADTDSFLFIDSIICRLCVQTVCLQWNDHAVGHKLPKCVPFWRAIFVCRQIYFVFCVCLWNFLQSDSGTSGNLRDSNCRSPNCKCYQSLEILFAHFILRFFFVFSSNLFWLNKKKKQVRTFWHDRFGEMKENSQSAQCCFCSEDKNNRAFFDIFTLFHRTLSILRPFEMVFAAIKAVSQTVFYNEKWKTWVEFHEPIKFVYPKNTSPNSSKTKKNHKTRITISKCKLIPLVSNVCKIGANEC